jgi:membrane-associated protease RseP (regulator of RpoE activity)
MASRLKLVRMLAMLTAGIVLFAVQVNVARSQGLLRRIQERVQSRVVPPTAPAGQAAQSPASDANTQRLSPLDRPGDEQATPEDSAGRLGQRARFGGSILSRPRTNQAEGGNPAAASRPSLGIRVVPLTEGAGGLRVAGIRPGSRAADSGLKVDDVIVSVEGRSTPSAESLAGILGSLKVGETVRATVMRDEQTRELSIPLVDAAAVLRSVAAEIATRGSESLLKQSPTETAIIGMGVNVGDIVGKRGVVVEEIVAGSSAQAEGLQVGDRIVSIDGRLVQDATAFRRELAGRAIGDVVSVNAARNDTFITFELTLQNRSGEVLPSAGPSAIAKNATESEAPASAGPASPDVAPNSAAGSPAGLPPILGGLRSALGGLFGGSPNNAAPQSPAADSVPISDGEPVQRVGFDEEIKAPSTAPSTNQETLPSDPPSVEKLAPPAGEVDTDSTRSGDLQSLEPPAESVVPEDKDQLIRELQDQVRQLQQRIRELEAGRP